MESTNRILTASGADAMNAESGLTFDGTTLTVGGSVIISSDLTVNGTTTTINTQTLTVDDPMVVVGDNNAANSVDLGIIGKYVDTNTYYSGLLRDASAGKFRLFTTTQDLSSATTVDPTNSGYANADLIAGAIQQSGATNGMVYADANGNLLGGRTISEGVGIDITNGSGVSGNPTITLDLSELSTSTSNGDGDFFVVVDSSNGQKKLTKANINLSGFNNDSNFSTTTGTVTSVGFAGDSGSTAISSSGTITFAGGTNVTTSLSGSTLTFNATDTNTTYSAGDGLDLTGTTFSTDLKSNGGLVIESTELAVDLGASSITGTLAIGDGGTGATSASSARTNLGLGSLATLSSITVANIAPTSILTSSELPATNNDSTIYTTAATVTKIEEYGYTTNTGTTTPSNTQTFTNKSGNISQWTNDSGYTTNVGDITAVTAGQSLTGGGTSGAVTLAVTDNSISALQLNVSGNGSSGQALTSDGDGTFSWTTMEVGDITGVTAGTGLSGGGVSGNVTLNIDSTVATLTGTQTFTNKTLTSPTLSTPTLTGLIATTLTAGSEQVTITDESDDTLVEIIQTGTGHRFLVDSDTGSGNSSFRIRPDGKVMIGLAENVVGGAWLYNKYDTASSSFKTNTGGSVGSASFTSVADTNTGMYFPAADTLGLTTGGVERLRLSSSGVQFNGAFTFPTADGSANQILQTDGSGTVSWVDDTTGDITGVTAGLGLSGGGTSGSVSLALDLHELTALGAEAATGDYVSIVDSTDNSTKKVLISNLPFGTGSGDITAVVASTGLSGGATSGSATLSIDSTVATLTGTQTFTNKTLTSPTLTTPALGTPSALVLTNATGFPTLNQNTTGSAATLTTGRTIAMTGDVVWNSGAFNGGGNVSGAATIQVDAVDIPMLSATGTASSSTFLRGDNTWGAPSYTTALAWGAITSKPSTFAPILGTTSSTALAGDTTTITSGQASAITANTAKVSNATHTGDVTGSTALTIASGAVDIAMLSATGTASGSTYLRGDNTWATIAGDITGVTAGTGLSGGGTSGSVTLNIDSTVATLTGTQTMTNKTLSSPTLTTPDLGTPTALVLTNATGFPTLNQNTTGSAATLTSGRTIAMTGDVVWNSGAFNGGGNVTATSTIQAGAVDIAMLSATGTASSSTYLRGDNTWAAVSGGTTGYTWTDTAGSEQFLISDTSDTALFKVQNAGTGSIAEFHDQASDSNYWIVDQYGRQSIKGTIAQGYDLTVAGAIKTSGVFTSAGSAGSPQIAFHSDTNTGLYSGGTDILGFSTAGTSRLTIAADGTVDVVGTLDTTNLTIGGAQGSDGQVLTSTGSGVAWEAASAGGATSIGGLSDASTAGTQNVGLGTGVFSSSSFNTNNSTALGYNAGQDITTGSDNVLLGSHAGANLTIGQNNIAIGRNAMAYDTASIHAIAIGSQTGENSTGDYNISMGSYAGRYLSGNYNINIGKSANDSGGNSGSGNVVIGNNQDLDDDSSDRQLIISGNDGTNTTTWIKGVSSGAITFNNAFTFPTSDGSANQVLQTDGSGTLTFATAGGVSYPLTAPNGGVSAPSYSFSNDTDTGMYFYTDFGNPVLSLAVAGSRRINVRHTGAIQFNDAFTFPTGDGSANQVLKTDGSGALSWSTPSSGGASSLDGLSDVLIENNSMFLGTVPSNVDGRNNQYHLVLVHCKTPQLVITTLLSVGSH